MPKKTGAGNYFSPGEISRWLAVFRNIGERASRESRKYYGTKKAQTVLGRGAGGDNTVWIDQHVENIVILAIKKEGNARLITEEAGDISFGSPSACVIADPVDGSNNAKLGIPMFAISLALAPPQPTLGNVELGYVKHLITGEEFLGIRGKGAFLNKKRIHSSGRKSLHMLGLEMQPGDAAYVQRCCGFITSAEKVRAIGSIALDLCYIASGAMDGVIDLRGRIRALDIAAASLVLQEAGGIIEGCSVELLDGVAITPSARVSFIASGNRAVHGRMAEVAAG